MLRPLRIALDRRRHRHGDWAELFESYQGDEVVSLDCETNAALDVTVEVNDAALPPDPNDTAALTVQDATAVEGVGVVFTVTLNNAVQGAFTVTASFTDQTATGGGTDYDSTPQVLNFSGAAGQAVQAMNLAKGFSETAGLEFAGLAPC